MYSFDIDDKDRAVKVLITKKIQLMKNFKTNILIENDVLSLKLIIVLTSTNSTYEKS